MGHKPRTAALLAAMLAAITPSVSPVKTNIVNLSLRAKDSYLKQLKNKRKKAKK